MAQPVGTLTIEMAANIARLQKDMSAARRSVDGAMSDISRSAAKAQSSIEGIADSISRGFSRVGDIIKSAFAVTAVYQFVKAVVDAGVAMQRLQKQFLAAMGSNKAGAAELEYVRDVSYRLGLSFLETANAYSKFAAALRGTKAEGEEARKVFEGFATAGTALTLSAADMDRVMRALTQMYNKNRVYAEELRLQLSEVIPNSYSTAAKVMKMTTAEFTKQMELGNILASDLLPKMAKAYTDMFGAAAVEGARMAQAEFQKFWNLMFELKASLSEAILPTIISGIRLLTSNINATKDAIIAIAQVIGSAMTGAFVGWAAKMAKDFMVARTAALALAASTALAANSAYGMATGLNATAAAAQLATAKYTAAGVAARTLAFVTGNWVTILITLLGSAAAAWAFYSKRQEEAANTPNGLDKVNEDLEKEIELLKERRRLREEMGSEIADMPEIDKVLRERRALEVRLEKLRKIMGASQPGQLTSSSPILQEYLKLQKSMLENDDLLKKAAAERGVDELARLKMIGKENLANYEAQTKRIEHLKKTMAEMSAIMEQSKFAIDIPESLRTNEQQRAFNDYYAAAMKYANANKELQEATKKTKEEVSYLLDVFKKGNELDAKVYEDYFEGMAKAAEETGDEMVKLWYDHIGGKTKAIESAEEYIRQTNIEAAALKISNTEREIAIQLLGLERAGLDANSEEYKRLAIAIREAVTGKQAVEDGIAQQKKLADEWKKTAEQIGQSLADALMEGGKSAWEYIQGLFRNLVFKVPLQNLVTGIVGSLGLGGTAMAAENGMGTALGLDMIATAATKFSAVLTNAGSLATSAFNTVGNYLAYEFTGSINAAGVAIQEMAVTAGAVGTVLAGAAAGYFGGTMIAGDYKLGGMSGSTTSTIGTTIGAIAGAWGGPIGSAIGAAIGGTIGGTLNRLFGREPYKLRQQNIIGDLSASGADLTMYTRYRSKGGTFSSDKNKRYYDDITGELDAALDASIKGIVSSTYQFADALGLATGDIAGYSKAIEKINIKGMTQEEIQKALEEAVVGFGESLASDLFSVVDAYKKVGETTMQTLARLATNLSSVNKVLDVLNLALYETSLIGADAASALVDMFGGLENFVSSTTAYYQEFYTEEERLQKTTQLLNAAFIALGKSLPANKQGFRDIVDSLDLTTTSGQATFRALMALAPAFDLVSDATEDNLLRLLNAQNDLLSEQQKAYIKQLDAARDVALAWVDTAQTITESIRNLLGGSLSTLSPEQKLATSGSSFQQALGMATAGDLEAAKSLPGLASSYLEAAQAYYASTPDYASIFDNVLAGLGSVESYGQAQQVTANSITGLLDSITAPSDNGQTVAALLEQNKILLEQNRLLQAGFNELIKVNQQGNDIAASTNNTLRLESTAA